MGRMAESVFVRVCVSVCPQTRHKHTHTHTHTNTHHAAKCDGGEEGNFRH
jgi:hypothetical protein